MMTYRISKYNPLYRNKDGSFMKNEWTSISDVGKNYNGRIFSMQEYLETEKKYLACFMELLKKDDICTLQVQELEGNAVCWQEGQELSLPEIENFCRQCLREQIWGKLESTRFFIHFGYDYYSYVGTELPPEIVASICEKKGLFSEHRSSSLCRPRKKDNCQ